MFGLRLVNGEEVSRKIRVSLTGFVYTALNSTSGDKYVFFPPHTGEGIFYIGVLMTCGESG